MPSTPIRLNPGANQTTSRPPSYIPNEQICAELIEHFRQSLDSKSSEWLANASRELLEAFAEWKEVSGDRSPRRWYEGKGLPRKKPIAFADAEPFECAPADAGVCDYPSLLLYLVGINDQRVSLILAAEGADEIVAVSVLLAPSVVGLDSLLMCLRLHDRVSRTLPSEDRVQLLSSVLTELAHQAQEQKRNLDRGRTIGAAKRHDDHKNNVERWRNYAIARIRDAHQTVKAVELEIVESTELNPARRALSTVHKALLGCGKLAKATPR
jgi:hypothetical protein